ncbi:hypothetical protein GP486_001920 [Trichoglossum hirsutum]|uniref:Uncharacterized protein n=1 Tax=Trichoglossum hirsutum TaxID=265104 RepID=A0A9P8RSM2_9PEZI|nr:hypothetical protein GP486_001920 [Trichoglossum hirsutum]
MIIICLRKLLVWLFTLSTESRVEKLLPAEKAAAVVEVKGVDRWSNPSGPALPNRIRDRFSSHRWGLDIGRLYLKEESDSVSEFRPVQLTNDVWSKLRATIPRGRVLMMLETCNTTDRTLIIELDYFLSDLPETSEIFEDEFLC